MFASVCRRVMRFFFQIRLIALLSGRHGGALGSKEHRCPDKGDLLKISSIAGEHVRLVFSIALAFSRKKLVFPRRPSGAGAGAVATLPQPPPPCDSDRNNCSCLVHSIGDGICDGRNNNEGCRYDGGDCCLCTCVEGTAFSPCGRRGYDCVDPTVSTACIDESSYYPLSSLVKGIQCRCEDDGRPTERIGDGVCDILLNIASCGYDGGDCCLCTCLDGEEYQCGSFGYDCQDPDVPSDCMNASFSYVPPSGLSMSTTSFASDGSYSDCAEDGRPVHWIGDGVCDIMSNNPDCGYDGGDRCLCTCGSGQAGCGSFGYACRDPTLQSSCVNDAAAFVPQVDLAGRWHGRVSYVLFYLCIAISALACGLLWLNPRVGRARVAHAQGTSREGAFVGVEDMSEIIARHPLAQ